MDYFYICLKCSYQDLSEDKVNFHISTNCGKQLLPCKNIGFRFEDKALLTYKCCNESCKFQHHEWDCYHHNLHKRSKDINCPFCISKYYNYYYEDF